MSADILRGQIEQGKIFYMYGVNKNSIIPNALSLDDTSGTYYFYLCLNRVLTTKGFEHRIFWSCDPDDFVFNSNMDSSNNGPLEFVYEMANGQYQLYYITTLNNDPSDTNRTRYGMNINFDEFPIENNSAFTFSINQDTTNSNYNVSPLIYTSIPYDISSIPSSVKPSWIFRQNNTTTGSTTSFGNIGTLPAVGAGAVGIFEHLAVTTLIDSQSLGLDMTAGGNYLQLDSPTVDSDVIMPNSGIIYVTDTTNEAMIYNGLAIESNNYKFNITQRGAFETTATGHLSATAAATVYDRQLSENFWYQKDNTSVNVNEEFYMYFLPKESNLFFPKGHALNKEAITLDFNTDIATYDYVTGNAIQNLNTSVIFFSNSIYNTLPSVYDFDLRVDGYSQSGIYTETNRSVLLYTNFLDAQQNYFYNYCTQGQTCGNCLGLTKNRKNICTVTSKTNKNYTSNNDNDILSSEVTLASLKVKGTDISSDNSSGMLTNSDPQWEKEDAWDDNILLPMCWGLPVIGLILILAIISYAYTSKAVGNTTTNAINVLRNVNVVYYSFMVVSLVVLLTNLGIFLGERASLNAPTINFGKDDMTEGQIFNYVNLAGFVVSGGFFLAIMIVYFGFVHVRDSEAMHQGIQGKPTKKIAGNAFIVTYILAIGIFLSFIAVGVLDQIYYEKISSRGVCEEAIVYFVGAAIILGLIIYLGFLQHKYNVMEKNQLRNAPNLEIEKPTNNIPMQNMNPPPQRPPVPTLQRPPVPIQTRTVPNPIYRGPPPINR